MIEFNKYRLEDICSLITKGTTPSTLGESFVATGINFVKSESITDYKYLDSSIFDHITERTHVKMARSQLKQNDLLFSIAGAYLGKIGIVRDIDLPLNTNQAVGIVRLNENMADVDYTYYYFSQKAMNTYINKLSSQSAQPNLNLELLGNLPIKLPDLPTQKKIADVLSCIDDKIALNNKTNTELENMAKTIYDYWFTQFDFPNKNGHPYKTSGGQMVYNETLKREIPAGWEVEQLRHYLDCNKNSITKNQKFDYINYLDTGSLTENIITEFQVIKNTDSLPSRAKRIVKKNDILYSSVRPLLKHYGIIKAPKENMIASTGFIILSSKVDSRYNDFFYNYIILESNLNKLVSIAASNVSAYPSINPDDLLDLYIPMPKDFNLLDDFISKIQPIYELINTNQKEAEELTKLRDYLLPLLMNGQIEVK